MKAWEKVVWTTIGFAVLGMIVAIIIVSEWAEYPHSNGLPGKPFEEFLWKITAMFAMTGAAVSSIKCYYNNKHHLKGS